MRATDPLVSFFDRRAARYDLQLRFERRALRAAAALSEPLAGARVVDVAAGTGAMSDAILERRPALGSLTAVDASPRMLARARRRVRPPGIEPRFVLADAGSVPLDAGCADLVTIGYLLHLLEPGRQAAVLGEARRLLRPGGRLVAVVHGSPGGGAGRVYRAIWTALGRALSSGAIRSGPIADLAPLVAAAGFAVDATRRVPGLYWSQVLAARALPAPADAGG